MSAPLLLLVRIMKLIIFVLCLFVQLPALASRIEISLGDAVALPRQSATLTNPRAVKAIEKNGKLVLVGRALGTSKLKLRDSEMTVSVFSTTLIPAREKLLAWIQAKPHLSMETETKKILVRGKILRTKEWLELLSFKHLYGSKIELLPELGETMQDEIVRKINLDIKRRSLTGASAQRFGNTIKISSPSQDPQQQKVLRELEKAWDLEENSETTSTIVLKPLVEVEIVIAEVRKSFARGLGLKLPDSYQASILPTENFAAAGFKGSPIDVLLNAFVNEASGKVLANPKLLCRSGETAKFLAGGELPIKISNHRTHEVMWKQYGVLLQINPHADSNGGISTKIMTEISIIDEGHKVDGVPGMLTNRIETHFDVKGSKTIALSGLLRREIGNGSDGVALLSEIPILGELFKSRNYRESRSELVIFVTPKIISPDNPSTEVTLPSLWHEDD